MKKWLTELFWQRCFYCKEKKKWFFFTWELPHHDKFVDDEEEICTDCVRKLK